ncbi:MAG TPA: FAD-binding oxidoreductase [Candidatus Kapabacteria bacterium]|nr:FAD-binding oxidoreductase [Candidatus Kapabacteria bacterium]
MFFTELSHRDAAPAALRNDMTHTATQQKNTEQLSGWGRVFLPGKEVFSVDLEKDSKSAVLFRGLGRSYGDSAIPPADSPVAVATPLADKIRFFDRETGRMRAEAGLSLYELNRLFLHENWFVPVTPGTQYVTLGGMVASDVHGKNHHVAGCFGEHVHALKMRVADGRVIECSMENEQELFLATIGGMGLTGHILEVEFSMKRIPSPWIWQETRSIKNVDEFIVELKAAACKWPFTVGWVDCLTRGTAMGRGILYCGRWATPEEAPKYVPQPRRTVLVPFVFPEWALGPVTARAFNIGIYRRHFQQETKGIVSPEVFFYPLDIIREWNKIYGPRGFTQYQCVLPEESNPGVTRRFFDLLTNSGGASFLTVIKDCGEEGRGMISFPKKGISVALDIAVRDNTQELIDTLNEFLIAEGGRIYLTKDTFTRREHFRAMEPRLDNWTRVRRAWDPEEHIRSAQSIRMLGDRA